MASLFFLLGFAFAAGTQIKWSVRVLMAMPVLAFHPSLRANEKNRERRRARVKGGMNSRLSLARIRSLLLSPLPYGKLLPFVLRSAVLCRLPFVFFFSFDVPCFFVLPSDSFFFSLVSSSSLFCFDHLSFPKSGLSLLLSFSFRVFSRSNSQKSRSCS